MAPRKRREREAEAKRTAILEAAARVFAVNGYEASTMSAIAKEAGYAAASLYSYFEGKQAIFEAMASSARASYFATYEGWMPAGLPVTQRFEFLLRNQLRWVEERKHLLIVFLSGQQHFPGQNAPNPREEIVSNFAHLIAWIETHTTPGELGGRTPEQVAMLYIGMTRVHFLRRLSAGSFDVEGGKLEDDAPALLDLMFYGVLGKEQEG